MTRIVRASVTVAVLVIVAVAVGWVSWRALSTAWGMGGQPRGVAPTVTADGWGLVRTFLWHFVLSALAFAVAGLLASLVRRAWRWAGEMGDGFGVAGSGWQLAPADASASRRDRIPMITTMAPAVELGSHGGLPLPGGSAFDVDPARTPHVLIVGKTGSGKSTLARHLLERFTRRYPSEVVVCDPDGVNWLEQTSASSTEGIAAAIGAVHGEFSRRQALLSEGGDAGQWPYLVLLVEETETVFERLKFVGDEVEDNARFELREVARMGRKAKVFLWAVTQVAAGDVFDLHVRRNMSVFCALSEPGVGRMLGVPKEVDLTRLEPGMVFASSVGQVLPFPAATATRLPLSGLYREGGAGGGFGVAGPQPVGQPVATGRSGVLEPVGAVGAVVRLEAGRAPSKAEAQTIRTLKRQGSSQNQIMFKMWGYKDKVVNDYVRDALEGRI